MADLQTGVCQSVSYEELGDALAVDAAVSDETLFLESVDQFPDEPGLLRIGEVEYPFDEVDDDAGSIHLTSPVSEAVDAGMPVELMAVSGTQAKQWTVHVESGDPDAEPLPAVATTGQDGYLIEGDTQAGVGVYYTEESDDTYRFVSFIDYHPALDGAAIDPTTLPTPLPTEAPAESPAITVTGMATGLMVTTEPIDQFSVLEYLIDGAVVLSGTKSTTEFLTVDGDGNPLMVDTDYSVTVVASNAVDAAPPSDAVVKRLDPGMTAELVAAKISAGGVVTGTLKIGPITIDADDGLLALLANGGQVVIPTNGDPISLVGVKLSAESADFSGKVSIKEADNRLEGGLTAANGVTKPLAGPTVSGDWPEPVQLEDAPPTLAGAYGFTLTSTHVYRAGLHSLPDSRVYEFDRTTGEMTDEIPLGGFWIYDLAQIDGNWYVAGSDSPYGDGTGRGRYVYVYDSSWTKIDEWPYTLTGTSPSSPSICANGSSTTTVRLSYWTTVSGQNRLVSQAYNAATGATSGAATIVDTASKFQVYGTYYGNADFGAARLVVDFQAGLNVYNTSGALADDFSAISNNRGVAWDGSHFYSIDTSGKIYQFSPVVTGATRSVTYTWFDSDSTGSQHETEASPATSFAQAARRWMRVTTPPPDDQGGTDDPDSVRIYVANKRQTDLTPGQTSELYGAPGTGGSAAPGSNTFPAALVPGFFQSELSDGSGKLTKFDGAGVARAAQLIQSGTVTVNHASGANGSTAVTFPVPFATTPRVNVSVHTSSPQNWRVSQLNASTTGVTVYAARDAAAGGPGASVTVTWTANTGH